MTIEQTIEIPANRRIFLDLPPDLLSGKARVEVRVDEVPPPGKTDAPMLSLMDLICMVPAKAKTRWTHILNASGRG
jgi:hypothetical protein